MCFIILCVCGWHVEFGFVDKDGQATSLPNGRERRRRRVMGMMVPFNHVRVIFDCCFRMDDNIVILLKL